MTEPLSRDDFRTALEDAIKGREASKASFSTAWAEGNLSRHHFARWARTTTTTSVRSPTTSATSTATPRTT